MSSIQQSNLLCGNYDLLGFFSAFHSFHREVLIKSFPPPTCHPFLSAFPFPPLAASFGVVLVLVSSSVSEPTAPRSSLAPYTNMSVQPSLLPSSRKQAKGLPPFSPPLPLPYGEKEREKRWYNSPRRRHLQPRHYSRASSSSFSSSSSCPAAYISLPVWKARNFFFSEKTCA